MSDPAPRNHESPFPDKELADLWKQQETPMAHTTDPRDLTQLAATVKADHRTEQARLLWLNIREVAATALMFVFFGYLGLTESTVLLAPALFCLGAGLFLVGSSVRQHKIEQRFDKTLRGSIQRSLSQAQHRFWMYRNASWWYIGPVAAAFAILYTWAIVDDPNGAKPGDAVVITLLAALFAGLHWWTRRTARTKWQPEIERYEALLVELDE